MVISDDSCLECFVIFGILEDANDCFGGEPVTDRVAARHLLTSSIRGCGRIDVGLVPPDGFIPAAMRDVDSF